MNEISETWNQRHPSNCTIFDFKTLPLCEVEEYIVSELLFSDIWRSTIPFVAALIILILGMKLVFSYLGGIVYQNIHMEVQIVEATLNLLVNESKSLNFKLYCAHRPTYLQTKWEKINLRYLFTKKTQYLRSRNSIASVKSNRKLYWTSTRRVALRYMADSSPVMLW